MRRALSALAGAAALSGCIDSTDPEPAIPQGEIELAAVPAGAEASMRPFAVFFRARRNSVQYVDSRGANDACQGALFSTGSGDGEPATGDVSVGDALDLTIGARAFTIPRVAASDTRFNYGVAQDVVFVPGDSARVNVPGELGQYPATTIAVRTAEPFTFQPVTVPELGEDLVVRWAPAGDVNSAMVISLRYGEDNATAPNRQIVCAAVDDGELTIEGALLSGWRASTSLRSAIAIRYRTNFIEPEGAFLHVISTYQANVPVTEPAD